QGNQLVLIEREHELTIAEGLEVATEPVRKRGVQARDGLSEDAPAQGRTAGSRIVRDHDGESRVARPGPEGRLAESGVAHHGDLPGIELRRGLEVIEHPAQAPGPGAGCSLVRFGATVDRLK